MDEGGDAGEDSGLEENENAEEEEQEEGCSAESVVAVFVSFEISSPL